MASRENQGLHIALILLVMLTVGLCIISFVFYSSSETHRGAAEDARRKRDTMQADLDKAGFKAQTLNYMIDGQGKSWTQIAEDLANFTGGSGSDEELDQTTRNFENNMMLFGPADQESETARNYEALPDFLLTRIRDLNQQLTDLRRTENQLTMEKANLENAANDRVKKAEEARDSARNDLTAERDKFTKDLADLRKQMETLATQSTDKDTRIGELNSQMTVQRDDFNKRIVELTRTVDGMRVDKQKYERKSFEVPDAIVSTINQKEGVLYINVGSADNLKPQQTFSVYDTGTTGVMDAKPKGSIEVLQIIGEHMAMCRVLADNVSNPIMSNDLVFTPAWTPGDRIHFAITGFIDITDSGQDDTDLLTKLIELNGGVVDNEVSVQTSYLIEGEFRTETASGDPATDLKDDFEKKMAAAAEIGVDRLSPAKLLTRMGWRADVTTITLGSGKAADVEGVRTDAPDAAGFRKRSPTRGADGAF